MSDFVTRMIGAARLQASTYEEVEADRGALGQAAGVVVLAAIAAGIGTIGAGGFDQLAWAIIGALVSWIIWAALTWIIGTRLLPETRTDADIGQLLRTIGFAATPGLLRIFGIIPGIGWIIMIIANLWMLVAMIVGVRQALDYRSMGRAVAVCFIALIIEIVIMAVAFGVFGVPGMHSIATSSASM